jgi:hypothetical protein
VPGAPGSLRAALMAVAATWITYFAALYLNFCDFSRYARTAALRQGQPLGPAGQPAGLLPCRGCHHHGGLQVYGEVLLHPDQISAKFDSWFLAPGGADLRGGDARHQRIMGTSMGGMFAQQMFGYKKIIINPAFHVSTIMRQNIGTIQFLNPRQDGATEYAITPELCEEYEEMEKHQFEGITEYDKTHTFAYFGKNDTLVHGFDEYHQHYQLSDWYAGEHRLRYQDIRDNMMAQIKKMLLEQ